MLQDTQPKAFDGEVPMKGLVFTTFFDFCEERFGADTLDDMIQAADLPHGGAYTRVGTYPFEEMVRLVTALVKLTGQPMPTLLESFGEYCFGSWVKTMPEHFDGKDLFDVLHSIDDFHDAEVRKLYPDAELPRFTTVSRDVTELVMDYRSCKPLADLASGVIRGASAHLTTPVRVSHCPVHHAGGAAVRFQVTKLA
jgi:hypothetical protein